MEVLETVGIVLLVLLAIPVVGGVLAFIGSMFHTSS